MRYLIYLRVSTDRQEIRSQEDECRDYIKAITPNAEIYCFIDEDVSSSKPIEKRAGGKALLESLKRGDIVVVWKFDRLSRDILELLTIRRIIQSKKCELYSVTENTEEEEIIAMHGIMAQLEKKNIRERIRTTLKTMKQRGERTGTIPYGYSIDQTKTRTIKQRDGSYKTRPYQLIENPQEQYILARMRFHHQSGESYKGVADKLNLEGLRNRAGRPWLVTSTYPILQRMYEEESLHLHQAKSLSLV